MDRSQSHRRDVRLMSKPFFHDGRQIICKTALGGEIVIAEAIDLYWADAIAYQLNIEEGK